MKYLLGLSLCVLLVLAVSCADSEEEQSTRRTRAPRPSRPPRPTRPTRPSRPPPPSRQPPPPRCESSEDCDSDECCITHDITGFRKGVCLKLANEGKRCSLKERVIKDKYLHSCPCVEGLSCEPKQIKTIPFVGEVRMNERCVNPNGSTSQPEVEETVSE